MPMPRPPAGAPATLVLPARLGDGSYATPNRALSPVAAVWHLRAALNVAALACGDGEVIEIDDDDLMDEAQVEHQTAKDLIRQIRAMSPDDALHDAKVKVLSEYVKHHVKEEESEMFEELGVRICEPCTAPVTFVSHAYAQFHLVLLLYRCRKWEGIPEPREGQALTWKYPHEMRALPMPPADIPLVAALMDAAA